MTQSLPGRVYLVGAGPGDPELLTVKAHRLLERAEVVLHDDLVPCGIVSLAGPQACVFNVGKRCGAKKITQEEINTLMIQTARLGMEIVRLKCGDPSIFGRLAEELDALESAGVPFEVVPGVTAGIAAVAALGFSLTDRRKNSRILLASGHHARKISGAKTDWSGMAREDTTLVVYMPGQNLHLLREELLDAGLPAETPAAVVSRATTPHQREWLTTLGELHTLPPAESPAVLLIGRSLERAGRKTRSDNSSEPVKAVDRGAFLASIGLEIPATPFTESFERRTTR
jgi:uroporphyrin-III C-methyltransferase